MQLQHDCREQMTGELSPIKCKTSGLGSKKALRFARVGTGRLDRWSFRLGQQPRHAGRTAMLQRCFNEFHEFHKPICLCMGSLMLWDEGKLGHEAALAISCIYEDSVKEHPSLLRIVDVVLPGIELEGASHQ